MLREAALLLGPILIASADELVPITESPGAAESEDERTHQTTEPRPIQLQAFRPQTGKERWREYLRSAYYSPMTYAGVALSTTFNTKNNYPPEWGQGVEGYAHRFGKRLAMVELQTAFRHGGAALAGHETGYHRCLCEGAWRRLGWALSRTVLTRDREGRTVPNYTYVGGQYAGAMISTYWYPQRFTPQGEGARWATRQLMMHTLTNVAREFWPDLKRVIKRNKD